MSKKIEVQIDMFKTIIKGMGFEKYQGFLGEVWSNTFNDAGDSQIWLDFDGKDIKKSDTLWLDMSGFKESDLVDFTWFYAKFREMSFNDADGYEQLGEAW